jgi:enoyl-CoA hydratase/carnithine racemase
MGSLAAVATAGAAEGGTRPQTFPLGIPKPIIAAINGACAGIGLSLALMCDIRFAAAGVKLTTSFARRGLVAEHGTSWLLPRLVGTARALDLLLSARVVLAEEACELGLVNFVVPREQVLPAALDYARDLARNVSPTSMSVIKRQVLRHVDLPLDDALAESNALMAESLRRPDVAEGVASFVERRPPRFEPLR